MITENISISFIMHIEVRNKFMLNKQIDSGKSELGPFKLNIISYI